MGPSVQLRRVKKQERQFRNTRHAKFASEKQRVKFHTLPRGAKTAIIMVSELEPQFPPPPIVTPPELAPLVSWAELRREVAEMGLEFDLFWYESVTEEVAYFFRSLLEPRCTVLVVWDEAGITHVECRAKGGALLSDVESAPIVATLVSAFRDAGLWRSQTAH